MTILLSFRPKKAYARVGRGGPAGGAAPGKGRTVALFRKKPPAEDDEGSGGGEEPVFEPQPEKARKWFEHARTSADSFNFAYALECYANGIKLDPELMSAHVAMLDAAVKYVNRGNKPATSREVRSLDDGTVVGKFAAAEFEWMKDLKNHKAALKALAAAVKAEQFEFGRWIAPRVLTLIRNQKKLSKGFLIQAMEVFGDAGAWDQALSVGEMARDLDPSDSDLDARLKNLTAQRAMDQGRYDEGVGEEGGFRKSIRDLDKQKELIEEESLSGGSTVEERNLERARIDYESNPRSPDAINKYAQLVKKRLTPEAEQLAYEIYMKGYDDVGEYRFRMLAGDIKIEQLERRLRELDGRLEDRPDDGPVKAEREEAARELLELKVAEYTERVKRYPTDRFRKYDLGEVRYELGDYDEAMPHFQAAKDEPKLRVRAGHMLGLSFLAEDWYTEAIAEFEEALAAIDATQASRELPIKYDLMLALLEAARGEDSIDLAKQAKAICSEIARKDITYRDIRAKRKEVDQLIADLTGGGG
jgi:tetratricopeptide (TPR) repeat protein